MHEYSLVESMLDQVDTIRRAQQADRVCSIRVGIGEFAGIEPDLFLDAFDLFRSSSTSKEPPTSERPLAEEESCETDRQIDPRWPNATDEADRLPKPWDPCHESGPFCLSTGGLSAGRNRTAWAQTELQTHVIPLVAECNCCDQSFHVEKFHFQCPGCESPDLTILQGEDLILENVILEEG